MFRTKLCKIGLLGAMIPGAFSCSLAAETIKEQSVETTATANFPIPDIGVRQEDLSPQYSGLWTFVWVRAPHIRGSYLDLLCYEHSGMTYLSHHTLEGGAIELRHRSTKDPHVLVVTTVTPEPGAVELVAQAEIDRQLAPQGNLPDKLPSPNLCFRVKRAEEAFSAYPDPFPEFISRCFIFTDKGRTFLTDTVRRKLPRVSEDDPRNNPPWVQIYSPDSFPIPKPASGKTWYNTSTDRYTIPVIGVVSRDRKHLVALANDSADRMTQAWRQCLHNNPHWVPKDAPPAERRFRVKLYIMPNDPEALLKRVGDDFPNTSKLGVGKKLP